MDLGGREIRGREVAQAFRVEGRAAIEPSEPRCVGSLRQLRLEHRDRGAPCRIDLVGHDGRRHREQLVAVRLRKVRDAGHLVAQCRDEWILGGRRRDEPLHLRDRGRQYETRRHHAGGRLALAFGRGLGHPLVDLREARDVVLRVARSRDRLHDRELIRQTHVDAGVLLERERVVEIRLVVDDAVELPAHHIGRHALGRCQVPRDRTPRSPRAPRARSESFRAGARGSRA